MSLTRRELLIGGAILFGAGAATAFAGVELKKNLTNPSENDSIFPENQLLDLLRDFYFKLYQQNEIFNSWRFAWA